MPEDKNVLWCEVCEHTTYPYILHGTIASMSPHMIGVQPPSLELGHYPELLDPLPLFPLQRGYVCQMTEMSHSVKYVSTRHLLTYCMVP